MATGDLGTLAAVRHAMDRWRPAESGTTDDRRSALKQHLRDYLDGSRLVETSRSTALPDVVVDGTVGILLVEEVSATTADRLEARLDRFDGEYPLLFVVGLDVRDRSVWQRLRAAHVDSGATIGRTEFVFESLASLRASNHDWGDWEETDEPWHDLRSRWVYPALAAGLLLVDELLRYAQYGPFLPDDPVWRLFLVGIILICILGEDLVRPWLHG